MADGLEALRRAEVGGSAAREGRVVYLGGFVDEAIVRERGLPSHNPAGSNRMGRIARAFSAAGFRPVVLSPATSLRAGRSADRLIYPRRIRRTGPVAVVFAPMLNIPLVNVLAAPLIQFMTLRAILRKGDAVAAVVYNFNPTLVLLTAYLKFIWRLPLVQNVEDVSEPRLTDWLPNTRARPVQQLVFWLSQHAVARMVGGYIVPTRRFLAHLPDKPKVAVVTGCIAIEGDAPEPSAPPLRVLFAGKIEREHGAHVLVDALKILDARVPEGAIQVDVTGGGNMADRVARAFDGLSAISAQYHGFVSGATYRDLLASAEVCVALQDPEGRYARFKTPSKVYEFLGYGKAVIATDVGDIAELGDAVLIVLPALDPQALADALERLSREPETTLALRRRARAHAQEHFSYAAAGAALRALVPAADRKGRR